MGTKKFVSTLGALILIIAMVALLGGCGATAGDAEVKKEDTASSGEFDQLFEGKSTTATQPSDDEAEVLELLGISQTKKDEPVEAVVSEKAEAELAGEIDAKNDEIKNLMQELESERQRTSDLKAQLATERSKVPTPVQSPIAGFKAGYNEARAEYEAHRYPMAIRKFEGLIQSNPGHSLADNCQYWIGECFFGLGDYTSAIAAFEKVFSFNESNKNADAQLKLGVCYFRLNDISRAREEFQRLLSHYPDCDYTVLAQQYLERL
ncbi:tetratricopeptide repeat protein [bacterium]|nr:tetratricopeptide repeat protein [bacterium]